MTTIVEHLNAIPGCRAVRMHGSVYACNEPDILGCLQEKTIALEIKSPGERARPAQLSVLRKWRRAGAVAAVVRSVADVETVLRIHGWTGDGWRESVPCYTLCVRGRSEAFVGNELREHLVELPVDAKTGKMLEQYSCYLPPFNIFTDLHLLVNISVATRHPLCFLYDEPETMVAVMNMLPLYMLSLERVEIPFPRE